MEATDGLKLNVSGGPGVALQTVNCFAQMVCFVFVGFLFVCHFMLFILQAEDS